MGQRQRKHPRRKAGQSEAATALTLYLDNLAPTGRRSARSRLSTAASILGYTGALEDIPWTGFGYAELSLVRARLLGRKKAPSTINATMAAMRGVLRSAYGMGLIPVDALLRLDQIKPVTGKSLQAGRSLTPLALNKLVRACQRETGAAGVRDAAMILLMALAGLRRAEVIGLTLAELDRRRGLVVVGDGKGRRQRELALPGQVRRALSLWFEVRGRSPGPLFCPITIYGCLPARALSSQRLYAVVVQRALEAGIDHCTPHDLRRTFVTRLLDNKVDLNTVRQLAGHSDIRTTAGYDRRDHREQRKALRESALALCG